jgi:hypothetical protein
VTCRACENLRAGWSRIDESDAPPQCMEHAFGIPEDTAGSWAVTAALIVLFFVCAGALGIGLGWLIDHFGGRG